MEVWWTVCWAQVGRAQLGGNDEVGLGWVGLDVGSTALQPSSLSTLNPTPINQIPHKTIVSFEHIEMAIN